MAVRLRFLVGLIAILAMGIPALPALGQIGGAATTRLSIDSPTEGATVTNGVQVDVGGWAADTAGPGTGVDEVRVYLDGRMDANGRLLGTANYGGSRPDVATALGTAAYANTGFDYLWTPSGLSAGAHTLYVYEHSIANGWAYKPVNVTAQVAPTPTPRPIGSYAPGPRPTDAYPYPGGYYGGGAYGPCLGMYGQYCGGPYSEPYPMYPRYPTYPGPYTPPGDRVCIMIYPPPPGC